MVDRQKCPRLVEMKILGAAGGSIVTSRSVVVRSFLVCCIAASLCVAILVAQAEVPEAVRIPTLVPGLDDVVDAAVGDHFFLVARADGSVRSWGYNNYGQLGNGRIGAMSAAEPGKTMGFVVQGRAEPVEGLTDVIGVAAGGEHALAVRRDGSVWGWGSNGSGQLAPGRNRHVAVPRPEAIPGIKGAVAVAARSSSSYALLADGTVLGWGNRLWRSGSRAVSSETPIPLPGVSMAVAIAAGLPSLALLRRPCRRVGFRLSWGWKPDAAGLRRGRRPAAGTSPRRGRCGRDRRGCVDVCAHST